MVRLRSAAAITCLASTLACATGTGNRSVEIPVPPPTRPVADLERDLAAPDAATRSSAAWDIAGAGTLSDATLRTLLDLSRSDADPSVRNAAAWAFGHQRHESTAAKEMAEHLYDQAPRLVAQARLVYPEEAFSAKVTGTVEVEILVDEAGNVARAEIRRSIKGLDEAALGNVRHWMFQPARKDGKPVPSTAVAPVRFRIY